MPTYNIAYMHTSGAVSALSLYYRPNSMWGLIVAALLIATMQGRVSFDITLATATNYN